MATSRPSEGDDQQDGAHRDGGFLARWWPRWLPPPKLVFAVLVLVALVVVLVEARSDFARTLRHLSVDRLPWLAAALGAEAVSFVCYAAVQRRLLLSGGARLGRRRVLALAVAATGLTNLVPGGTAPASGWLVGQYRRHGVPMPLALWAVLAGGYAATVSVLLLLLVGAGVAGLLGPWATVGLGVVLAAVAVGLVVCANHAPVVERWLRAHRFPGAGAARGALGQVSGVVRFRPSAPVGAQVFALSLGNWGMDVVCLVAAFALLGLPVPWRDVLFAYAAAQVAGSLAPVPGGIGFVEGGMIGAFALAGTPATAAVVATVVYRVITCFGMAGVGSIVLLVVTHRDPYPARLGGEAAAAAAESGNGSPAGRGGAAAGASGPAVRRRLPSTTGRTTGRS